MLTRTHNLYMPTGFSLAFVGKTSPPYYFLYNKPFSVSFTDSSPARYDWVAIYSPAQCSYLSCNHGAQMYLYNCGSQSCSTATYSGTLTFGPTPTYPRSEGGLTGQAWPLALGSYQLVMLLNDGYTVLAGEAQFSSQ